MKTNFSLLTTILVCLFLASCVDDAVDFEEFNYRPEDYNILTQTLDLPENPFEYTVELPSYMTRTGLFARPISDNRATLGRVLFYDKSLSHNKSLSCAGCHKQELAFADNRKFSLGFKGEETERNSLALGSVVSFAAYYGATSRAGLPFFWDERASSVSVQSLATLTNNVEMGMTRSDIVAAVKEKEYYRVLFEAAYRDAEITEERILLALESFVDGIGSYESKLDKAIEAEGDFFNIEENLRGLSTQENRGKAMFIQNCGSCHGRELARPGMPSANNGLDLRYADKGMGLIYGSSQFNGVFKVPALRNVEVTGPYMHDGRFESLEEVLDFYSEGIQNHTNLNPFLREEDGSPKRFNFSQQDKDDIISFLRTLTDHEMMSYEKYSNPFK